MTLFKRIIILAALILSVQSITAQFRKYSNEFLNIGVGARGLGMGSAQAASAKDGNAGYWNPAGLANVQNTELNLMHSEYFGGIGKYDYASIALPSTDQKRTLGASLIRFAVDDIPNTLFLVNPDGSINYNNIKTFSSADYALLLSYSQRLKQTTTQEVNFGVNAKVIHRSVGSFAKAWGFGLDAGVQVIKNGWHFGVVVKDVTTTFNNWKFSFDDKEKEVLYLTNNDIPVKSSELTAPRLTLGAGKLFALGKKSTILAEIDFDVTFDGQRNTLISSDPISIDPKLGLEYAYNNTIFVRGGINNFQKGLEDGDLENQKRVWIFQPSVGVGFKVNKLGVDYTFANLANQSNPLYTHVISLKIDFKNRRKTTKVVY